MLQPPFNNPCNLPTCTCLFLCRNKNARNSEDLFTKQQLLLLLAHHAIHRQSQRHRNGNQTGNNRQFRMIRPRNKHEGVRWLAILANSTIRDSITRHDKAKRVEAIGNSADCVRAKYEAQYYSDPPPRSTAFANCQERHTLLVGVAVGNPHLDQRQQALGRAYDAQEISAAPVLAP